MGAILHAGFKNLLGSKERKTTGATVAERHAGEKKARTPNDGRRLKRAERTEYMNMRVRPGFKDQLFDLESTEAQEPAELR